MTGSLDWVDEPHRFKIFHEGRLLTAYNKEIALARGCYIIDVDSEFKATDGELHFGQDGHSYLGVRVADAIDEEDGGLVTDSAGRSGCDAINEQEADWVDYSGSLGKHALGIAVHPANLPTPFRARTYGFFGPSPFFAADHRLPAGGRLLFRYRVVVHDGDASAVDLPRLFDESVDGPGRNAAGLA